MELNSNLIKITTSYTNSTLLKDELFPFETCSSKGTCYLRDFHQLDQLHVNGLSLNPNFASCNFDPYHAYTYEGSSTNFDSYEYKPSVAEQINNNSGHAHGQVMDNFQSGEYLNFTNTNIMDSTGSDHSCFLPLNNYQEIIKSPVNFVIPDEVSSITPRNGYFRKIDINKSKTSLLKTTSSSYKVNKKSIVVKGQWTIEEDRLLIKLVEQHGMRKWSHIAQMLPGRIGKQCRERWHNHLRPDIKKDTWSEEEDKILIETHEEIGNKWAEIAKRLPGRTENSIKNHWNATKRRQYSKRKCRSKYPRATLLQDYIKSLNLDSPHKMGKYQGKNCTSSSSAAADNKSLTKAKLTSVSNFQPENSSEICLNNQLIPNYDFNEDPDFCFDDKIFQEGYNIDSLLDDTHCAPLVVEQNNFTEKLLFHPVMEEKLSFDEKMISAFVVDDHEEIAEMEKTVKVEMNKQEKDLVELIFQVNEINA